MRSVVRSFNPAWLRIVRTLLFAVARCAPLALAGACTAVIGGAGADGDDATGEDGDDDGEGGTSGSGGGGRGGSGGAGGGPAACREEHPGVPTVRRLTSEELARSLKALLGRDLAVAWPQDELVGGYASARDNLVLEPHARTLYTDLLPELRKVVSAPTALSSSCATLDTRCATSLVDGFASRAWRRPLSAEEKTSLLGFYDAANKELADPKEATAQLLLAVLSSPNFLYRSELGTGGTADGARKLSSREVGTALSFFFVGQPPDATMLTKIAADGLQSERDVVAEIDRLRASPAHADWMVRFFQQWTHVHDLAKKDHALDKFPDATTAYKQEAEQAFARQVAALLGKPDSTFEELVSGTSFVAGPLTAKAYRAGAKPSGFETIEAEGGRRGLFMTVAFLTQYSKPDRPSSIERAKFLLDQTLCLQLPGVPADALQREFTPDPKKSPRQNFEVFTSGPACAGCHRMLNPLGFGFDHYGPDGQRLTMLDGFPVDTRGTVSGSGDLDGDLTGPEDVALKLAQSPHARACFLRQSFRFANGRKEAELDDCTLERMLSAMEKGGDSLTAFARNYFTSRNFLYRQTREAP